MKDSNAILAVTALVSILLGYTLKLKKARIQNVESAIAIWQSTAAQLQIRVEILNEQVNNLLEQNKMLKMKITDLEITIENLNN